MKKLFGTEIVITSANPYIIKKDKKTAKHYFVRFIIILTLSSISKVSIF